jgi:osmotically-inducible protein OsmY
MPLVAAKPMPPIHPMPPIIPDCLLESVRSAIADSPYRELHHMKIQFEDGSIRLIGRVSCFYFKQVAQEVTRKAVPGVKIQNELIVGD